MTPTQTGRFPTKAQRRRAVQQKYNATPPHQAFVVPRSVWRHRQWQEGHRWKRASPEARRRGRLHLLRLVTISACFGQVFHFVPSPSESP